MTAMTDLYNWQPSDYRMQIRAEFYASMVVRKVKESDPADWPQHPVTVRSWREAPRGLWRVLRNHARRSRQIMGYEYRKAAGCPRYHGDPKQFAIVKGITS